MAVHYPPPCFCQRVRNCLKIKGLSFWLVQKSAEEYEKKRDSENCSKKKSSEKNPSILDARSPRSSGQAGCASLAGRAMRKCSIEKGLKLNSRKKSVTRTCLGRGFGAVEGEVLGFVA